MKYHNFSEAIRGHETFFENDDMLFIMKKSTSTSLYVVQSIKLIYDNSVVIRAYSTKYMQAKEIIVLPLTYRDLMNFEHRNINNPQSFIPLGSAFDKDLPDLRIFLDEIEVDSKWLCKPTRILKSRNSVTVEVYEPKDTDVEDPRSNLPIDYMVQEMEQSIKDLKYYQEQQSSSVDDDNHVKETKKDKDLIKVEVITYEINTPTKMVAAHLNDLTLAVASEIFFVEEFDTEGNVLGLKLPENKIKMIPLNRIKEINIG